MIRRMLFSFVLALALLPSMGAAQGMGPMPATPVPGEAPTGVLAQFTVDPLPTPHAEVWFLRMQLDPGGSLPEGAQIGPVVVYIESGQLTLTSDVAPEVAGASTAVAGDMATPAGMQQVVLETGGSAMVPAGTMLAASNEGDQPVTFLVAMAYAAELEGTVEEEGEPVGLSQMLLSAGGVEFPPMSGQITIERVEIAPDELSGEMRMAGIELGVVEQGQAAVTFMALDTGAMLWPGILNGDTENSRVSMTGSATLTAGDGYSSGNAGITWLPMGDTVTVLRVVVGPEMPGR